MLGKDGVVSPHVSLAFQVLVLKQVDFAGPSSAMWFPSVSDGSRAQLVITGVMCEEVHICRWCAVSNKRHHGPAGEGIKSLVCHVVRRISGGSTPATAGDHLFEHAQSV